MTRKHWTSASTANPLVTIFNKYIYDWVGRKQKTWEQITNGSSAPDTLRLVSNTTYNEIGQMAFKKLDSKDSVNFMQSINYKYNERGWLLSSSTSLFAMTLYYNTNAGNKAYNGNIMYQYWGVPGNLTNHYTYTYDELNRLTSGITSADNFQESGIAYDIQGNLSALNRYQAGTQIDQLSYSYTVSGNPTNQLQSVVDANGSNSGLVSGTTSYTYDGNGNMRTATNALNGGQNKNITYNLLNLPLVVTVPNGTDTYTYDATGNKLRMVKVIGGATTNTDYIGGIQYNGSGSADTLSFIQTEEGKAVHNGTTYDYQYYLSDNLGNTRITFNTKNGIAKTIQQDDYYPFGLEILRTGPHDTKNEYLYNKKELQEDFTEYDFGARFYDPVIGRWTSLDPLAELGRRWSTYNYVEDDPIRFIDPNGDSVAYDGNNVTYYGQDAINFAWGLKIAGDKQQGDKDKDRDKAKADQQRKDQEEANKRVADAELRGMQALAQMLTLYSDPVPAGDEGSGTTAAVSETVETTAATSEFGVNIATKIAEILEGTDPLSVSLKNAFTNGDYQIETADEDFIAWKSSSDERGAQMGEFLSLYVPVNQQHADEMLNILKWTNTGEFLTPVKISKGTVFAKGPIAGGTGTQIFIPELYQNFGANQIYRWLNLTMQLPKN